LAESILILCPYHQLQIFFDCTFFCDSDALKELRGLGV
jgi:hypothetical protein